ncbi:hypothetical protein [Shewanella surugensis]|uniref:DUF1707 domain-containing protein n=1 Tax=Shewanella surugensis TaxID=212020 RepID=A0ABT0LI73_9GAMM|nr:hypothetical protein [Shewanella surugensis]MCL1127411.1 hypothetical protein [Shewanella surugensis]
MINNSSIVFKYTLCLIFVFTLVKMANITVSDVMQNQQSEYRDYYLKMSAKGTISLEELDQLRKAAEKWKNDTNRINESRYMFFMSFFIFMLFYFFSGIYFLRKFFIKIHPLHILIIMTIALLLNNISLYQATLWSILNATMVWFVFYYKPKRNN